MALRWNREDVPMLKMLVGIIAVIVSGVFCMAMAKAARCADDRMEELQK